MSDPAEKQHAPAPPATPQAPTGWAAPGAPPFGTPTAPPPAAAGYALPAGYAPPPGYSAGAPAAPGVAPAFGQQARAYAPAAPAGRGLGVAALVIAVVATVGAALAVAVAAFAIGLGTGREIAMQPLGSDFDWGMLAPVRGSVLLAETAFWVGTALGIWALVQGVIAIVKGRGRGAAIAAVVIAALGPVVFFVVLQGFLAAGYTAGSGIGG